MKLGSLFSGSGGFELAARNAGITPVWNSEVEPFPILVTKKRFPDVKHLGNIEKIKGSQIESVDIITFGSPCQDMSIAGKRKGLDAERSGLFYEAIRVISEMREATEDKYPRYIVWENVPGTFSSNKGVDFKNVLERICKIKNAAFNVPMPENGKWTNAGLIVADCFSLAWRVLDAAYFGVPQRRKRVFLVADFAGGRAGQILFEQDGLSGDTQKSRDERKAAAGGSEESFGAAGGICLNDQGGYRMDITEDMTSTLRANANHPPIVFENHGQDSRNRKLNNAAPTISSKYGTGGNNQPFVVETQKSYDVRLTSENTRNVRANVYETDTSRALDTGGNTPNSNQGGVAVVSVQGSMVGRKPENGPQGSGINEDVSFTLNSADRHAVAYGIDRAAFNQGKNAKYDFQIKEECQPTLTARGASGTAHTDGMKYIVRRLTPLECCRLQGFPDYWCESLETENPNAGDLAFWRDVFDEHCRINEKKKKTDSQIIKWLKSPNSDGAQYRMWGNGIALPCAEFILKRIDNTE